MNSMEYDLLINEFTKLTIYPIKKERHTIKLKPDIDAHDTLRRETGFVLCAVMSIYFLIK